MARPESGSTDETALAEADAAWAARYGAGSRADLRAAYARALADEARAIAGTAPPGTAPPDEIRARVEREHRARHGAARLAAELADERARDAAVTDGAALVAYEAKWSKRLARLQRAHPARWRLPGLSDDELRDELTLRLVEALRAAPEARARRNRAGREWGLLFLAEQRAALRRTYRLRVELADVTPVLDRALPEDERLIEQQAAEARAVARARAEAGLSRPQRRWLAAMKMTANAGTLFTGGGRVNLSAAARLLERNRSSAVRAFDELQHRFARELEKVEG